MFITCGDPDEPVPYLPALHMHTFGADLVCTQCEITLADWQQEMYAEIAHIALGDGLTWGRCPTCGSRQPSMHPAAGDGGEVTRLCPDPFHEDDETTRAAKAWFPADAAFAREIAHIALEGTL